MAACQRNCGAVGYGIFTVMETTRWRMYSGLVLCKSIGNSGVTTSTSRHWKLQESSLWRWFHIVGQSHTGLGVASPGCDGGLGLRVGLAICQFLCAGKYTALLSTQLMKALRLQGSCSWLGEHKGSWIMMFLSRMCCHKASWAVLWLVAFQGVQRKPCMLLPVGGNFWPCFSRVNFSHFFYLRLCRRELAPM